MTTAPLVDRLRLAILSLDLAPGQRLSERGLEPGFGASRTPIRAALMRLESEGLTVQDGKGWAVAPLDVDEIRALYQYRELLETGAIRLVLDRATPADIAALAHLAQSVDPQETPEHSVDNGTSFHHELARLSNNDFLTAAVSSTLTRLYRTRWLEVQSPESRKRVRQEHTAIASALRARDAAAAELAVITHLRGAGARLIDSIESSHRAFRARGIDVVGAAGPATRNDH